MTLTVFLSIFGLIIFFWGVFMCRAVDGLRYENAELKIELAKKELEQKCKEDK